jgi:hypothetical protein
MISQVNVMEQQSAVNGDRRSRKYIGLFFIGLGFFFIAQSAGLLPINEQALCAPLYIFLLIGGVVCVMGIMLVVGYDAKGYELWAALLLVLMGTLFLWFSLYLGADTVSCGKRMPHETGNELGGFARFLGGGMGLVAYAAAIGAVRRFISKRQNEK